MRIIRPDDFTTMPWKNGGGITHEIARADDAGRLIWRLSIAEVASDGPFSAFPGLTRILTVIAGAGLVLRSPEGVMVAEPFAPLRFSGDLGVSAERIAGDVRDLNLIFDGARIAAGVTRRIGPVEDALDAEDAVLVLSGDVMVGVQPVPPGAVAQGACGVTLAPGAAALIVRIARI
jgi:hypothetical protein